MCRSSDGLEPSTTAFSFALRLLYLLEFSPIGLAVADRPRHRDPVAAGRTGDVVRTGVTTAVVIVVAALAPRVGATKFSAPWTKQSESLSAWSQSGSPASPTAARPANDTYRSRHAENDPRRLTAPRTEGVRSRRIRVNRPNTASRFA